MRKSDAPVPDQGILVTHLVVASGDTQNRPFMDT